MLEFRNYEPGDFGSCLDLIREGHDSDFSENRFRWLHECGPAGPSKIAVCLENETIVGMYSVLPKFVHIDGNVFCGGRDVDPVVHPSFRGKGVFSRLLEFGLKNFQGLDFFFNFANPASAPGFRKLGWQDVMQLEDRVYQLGFRHPFSRQAFLWGIGRLSRHSMVNYHTTVLSTGAFEDLLSCDPRFESPGEIETNIGVIRNAEYLKWRYLDNPLHKYEFFLAEDQSGGACVAICRFDITNDRLMVVDLAGFGIIPRLSIWLAIWKKQYPNSLVVAWNSLPQKTLLGFIGNPLRQGKGQPFLVREAPLGKGLKRLTNPLEWKITLGDLEIV